MITKIPGPSGKVRIIFSLPSSMWADHIHLVGDFNDWNPISTPLRLDDTSWSVTLDLEAEQSFQYRYLINNVEWINDWQADYFVPNDLGSDNSVVVATLPREKPYVEMNKHISRQRPPLRLIQGGKVDKEKQAV